MKNDENIPAAVTMGQMAKLLNLSRARFYMLLCDGTFLPPIYSLDSKKPYYPAEMARKNLEVKFNNTGINGKVILFYAARDKASAAPLSKQKKPQQENQSNKEKHSELVADLKSLELPDITAAQVESAITICFPNRVQDVEEAEVLRTIFRHLKRQNSEHKQST